MKYFARVLDSVTVLSHLGFKWMSVFEGGPEGAAFFVGLMVMFLCRCRWMGFVDPKIKSWGDSCI